MPRSTRGAPRPWAALCRSSGRCSLAPMRAAALGALVGGLSLSAAAVGADDGPPLVPGAIEEPAEARRVDLKWTTGFDFSRGDYGLDDTTTLFYMPFSLTVDIDRLRLKGTIPLLLSDGPVRVELGGGAEGTRSNSDLSAGLGQLQLGASYLFDPPLRGLPFVELGGRLTLPTETREALGTGDVAFSAQIDLFRPVGILSPYVSAGRKWYDSAGLRDRFFTSIGASVELREGTSLGLAYDWLESTSNEAEDAHELVPYLSFGFAERWTFGPYAVIGLSKGSPDYGVGMTLSVRQ